MYRPSLLKEERDLFLSKRVLSDRLRASGSDFKDLSFDFKASQSEVVWP